MKMKGMFRVGSTGQLNVDKGTEQVREKEVVQMRERGDGEIDHDEMRAALLRAAAVQTPERDVADVYDLVRRAARALMAAMSVGWNKLHAVGCVGQVQLGDLGSENRARRKSMQTRLKRRDLVSPLHSWSIQL